MPTMNDTDTRFIKLVDIPLVRKLTETGTVLDSEAYFTRDTEGVHSALFSSLFLPQRGLVTLLCKSDEQQVVGQFRMRPDDNSAQIVYIAPELTPIDDDTAWLHLLDAMVAEAGKRGAHTLIAEVDEYIPLFQTMRISGFAIYARQEIWQRLPGEYEQPEVEPVELSEETEADEHGIHLLYSNIVPKLVQQVAVPPIDGKGWVYRKDDRVEGYILVSRGKSGVYLVPYLHPDVFSEASAIIAGAIAQMNRGDKLPVYVCVRRYQDWLEEPLIDLGFEPWLRQAVMVRHIAAGIRQTAFAPLHRKLEVIPSPVRPPTTRIIDTAEISKQE
jgi:hypothetical protein